MLYNIKKLFSLAVCFTRIAVMDTTVLHCIFNALIVWIIIIVYRAKRYYKNWM